MILTAVIYQGPTCLHQNVSERDRMVAGNERIQEVPALRHP